MPIGPTFALFFLVMAALLLPVWPWTRGWSARPAISFGLAFLVVVLAWVTILL